MEFNLVPMHVDYAAVNSSHLDGIISICKEEGWPTFPAGLARAWRALTAPGVTTVVAVAADEVVGFAYLQSDGEVQAHLSLIAVKASCRRRGIAKRLVEEAFRRCGAERIDLVSTDGADDFYKSFEHRSFPGYRIYPARK